MRHIVAGRALAAALAPTALAGVARSARFTADSRPAPAAATTT